MTRAELMQSFSAEADKETQVNAEAIKNFYTLSGYDAAELAAGEEISTLRLVFAGMMIEKVKTADRVAKLLDALGIK